MLVTLRNQIILSVATRWFGDEGVLANISGEKIDDILVAMQTRRVLAQVPTIGILNAPRLVSLTSFCSPDIGNSFSLPGRRATPLGSSGVTRKPEWQKCTVAEDISKPLAMSSVDAQIFRPQMSLNNL